MKGLDMDIDTPRTKPFYINENCEFCETQLIQVGQFDEWACPNNHCSSTDCIVLDWPTDELERLLTTETGFPFTFSKRGDC